jgi:hypothetical protein
VVRSVWDKFVDYSTRPLASFSNAVEDTGKLIGRGIARTVNPQKEGSGSWGGLLKNFGSNFLSNQKGAWTGTNKRTFSTVMNEMADAPGQNHFERGLKRTLGMAGDIFADPLNKVSVLGLTNKGKTAVKTGSLALSAAEQAQKGERALLQIGSKNILPSVGNKVLQGSTAVNDWIRGTKIGGKAVNALSALSTKVRPAAVARDEWDIISKAKDAARNTSGYMSDKTIDLATDAEKILRNRKATQAERAILLEAVELGDEKIVPKGLEDLWATAMDFKKSNDTLWKKYGGSILEGQGLSHIATKEVADASRKQALKGGKIFSPNTPNDAHRQWVKVDGKIVNLADEGISYVDDAMEKGKGGFFNKAGQSMKVDQATAGEVNRWLKGQGKSPLFRENLPEVMARMGLSTGKKKAGWEFLEATKAIKSEAGKKLVNETYQRMTDVEALNKAIQGYDTLLGYWKAQALISPSYHVRNMAGNFWNNYLAGVNPADYADAMKIQTQMKRGTLTGKTADWVEEMKQHGILGEGQYAKEIEQVLDDQIRGGNWKPWSRSNKVFKGNRAVGSVVEDNARIAHYLTKRKAGFTAVEAARSVKEHLFDYGDLTWTEKNVMKRLMPFYTWTSKNIPLQVKNMFQQPGKYSKIAVAKKAIEDNVPQTDERWLNDYIKSNSPIRLRQDKEGNTQYLLLGQWLPASSAISVLSQPLDSVVGMLTPALKMPAETLLNKSSFFKDTMGSYTDLEAFPGQKKNFLGLDLSPKTINVLRSIRMLNELDKLNPGEIWGSKKQGSVWADMGFEKGSRKRGSRYSPDSDQTARMTGLFVGKTSNYDPQSSKYFYDRETQDRVSEYKKEIKDAQKNQNSQRARKVSEEMRNFLRQRNGQ